MSDLPYDSKIKNYFIRKTKRNLQGCMLWTGKLRKDGYVNITIGSRKDKTRSEKLAHRVAYIEWRGKIEKGLVLDHLCRNRHCINPWHLQQVTQRENIMRGNGLAAKYIKLKTCINGHEKIENNIYRNKYGIHKGCKICCKERKLWRKKK